MKGMMSVMIYMACMSLSAAATGAPAGGFSAADVYRQASPSVVLIFAHDDRGNGTQGTGTLITYDGKVLTNRHVVKDKATGSPYENIVVFFKPDRITGERNRDLKDPFRASVLGSNADLDLAVLDLSGIPANAKPLVIGDSEEVEVGEQVAAIGHPSGGGLWTLTTGTVSSRRKRGRRDVFQTDTALNPGNSGGPLLDRGARLIGINTFIVRHGKGGAILQGLNYSLRSVEAAGWLGTQGIEVSVVGRDTPPTRLASAPQARKSATPKVPDRSNPSMVEPAKDENGKTAAADPKSGAVEHTDTRRGPDSVPEPPAIDGPQSFEGPAGERMYGFKDRDFDLEEAMTSVIDRLGLISDEAFDDMEKELGRQK